ncbi:hypothetical protein N7505_001252 [Penicillium chrysogenum]|uniref:Uncharacterized protein n=1 Tax=Penicillium chrysogenum TaxID=5076 RepID=A0ABQ8WW55_PENCH|nr:hypothetical protein N7505_001252 [Penicillium chrysogenum]
MSFRAKPTDFPKKTRSVYGKATKLRGRKQLILTGRYSLHTATWRVIVVTIPAHSHYRWGDGAHPPGSKDEKARICATTNGTSRIFKPGQRLQYLQACIQELMSCIKKRGGHCLCASRRSHGAAAQHWTCLVLGMPHRLRRQYQYQYRSLPGFSRASGIGNDLEYESHGHRCLVDCHSS